MQVKVPSFAILRHAHELLQMVKLSFAKATDSKAGYSVK